MAKVTLDPIGSFTQAAINTINNNMDRVETAVENTLSRDGTTPNQMESDIDMNHNDLINVRSVYTDELVLDGTSVDPDALIGPQGPQGEQGPAGADGLVVEVVAGSNITVDNTDPARPIIASTASGSGTVTSVDLSVPTGLQVSGNPITTSGTFAITFASGYSIPTNTKQGEWDTAYGWGNHASAGYLTTAAAVAGYQPLDADLTAIASLTTTAGGRGLLTLSDPNADRIVFWDDSSGVFTHLTVGTGLTITTTTIALSSTAQASLALADTAVQPSAIREKLTAARNYYVRTDGSDSNNGLANTSGGAFLTIQKAIDVTLGTLDLGGNNVTINVAAGTYASAISFASAQVGAGNITINGDTTTPSNVTVGAITVDGAGCRLFIQGLHVDKGTGQFCVNVKNGGYLKTTGKNRFSSTSGGHRFMLEQNAVVECVAAEEIQGTIAGSHYQVNNGSVLYCQGATWTAIGTAAHGLGFAYTQVNGAIFAFSNSSSGTFTGPRYGAVLGGAIQTNGGGASYFPGNSAGSTATGGQYA